MTSIGASAKPKVQPGLRRPEGKRGSIREVRLVGVSTSAEDWEPGDRVGWWGRSYEVAAAEAPNDRRAVMEEQARSGSPCYLHLRPVGPNGSPVVGQPVGKTVR